MDEKKGQPAGSHLDVARREADLAERASEARFQSLADESPVILWESDANGDNKFANQTFRDFFGVTVDQLEGRRWQPLLHPEDAPSHVERFFKAVRERAAFNSEARHRRKDGEWRWLLVQARPRHAPTGEFLGHVGVCVDVTERKRAEEALRESEEQLSALSDNLPNVAFYRYQHDDEAIPRFLYVSRHIEQQYGVRPEEVLRDARSLHDAILPDDRARLEREEKRSRETLTPFEMELSIRHRVTGEERHFLLRSVPVSRSDGVTVWYGLQIDVTEMKRAEEALREQDARKAQFLAVLSHELRNPLAPIRNSIYLLERSAPGSKKVAHAVEVIRRQTEHLARLINDLLDVTRISRGKILLERTRVDLRDIVRRTTDDQRSLFVQANIDLHIDDTSGPVWITADATRITQVLGNLLQNAVKFTPAGGSTTVTLAAKGDHAEIRVRDTGVGMEPGAIERMFQPFVQAEMTLARTKGGLGLGLALVKGLVELHGGTVEARSDGPGLGTEFLVRLPLAELEAKTGHERHEAAVARSRTVLVIEDNLDSAETLAEVLEFQGHHARVARDGKSGLKLARELHPEVVLCDIGLPDIDGYEVAREIRGDPTLRATRLVALSGYAQPEDRQRSREAGFDAHVAKPPDIDELERQLH